MSDQRAPGTERFDAIMVRSAEEALRRSVAKPVDQWDRGILTIGELIEAVATAACEHGYHDDHAARVGDEVDWWQCSRCGRLERRVSGDLKGETR